MAVHNTDHAHAHFDGTGNNAIHSGEDTTLNGKPEHDAGTPDQVTEKQAIPREDGKRELTDDECEGELGYSFSKTKKWTILTVIFLVQTSMNFNTSLYSNGLGGITEKFGVSEQDARWGAAVFLILYAFGCELWAPWSEEVGRKPVLQLSLFLVNIWCLPVALAPNFASLMVGRALGGLSSAGGSVTLGMIADIFESDEQQYAVAYIVFSSVGGSVLGPIVGGFVEQFLAWEWCIWIQLIFGVFVQVLHLICVPETRTTVMIDRIAKKRRKSGQDPNCYGPNELEPLFKRLTVKELINTWIRPFRMFLTEPIVLVLSLLSGFSDALIFMQIQSLSLVYKQWGFNAYQIGLSFIPFAIGYFIAWGSFIPAIKRNKKERALKPHDEHAQYESRLKWLLWLAPCLPIGLIIFAWTSGGPPVHWIGSMFGTAIIGIANYAIYMATIDYMICAYGPYSASATGGNGWARDFLAGVLTVPATPFYTNIGGKKHLQYATTILFCIAAVLVLAVYVIYWQGPNLRKRSPFAQNLAAAREEKQGGHRVTKLQEPRLGPGSRRSSYTASMHAQSRHNLHRNPHSQTGSFRPDMQRNPHSHTGSFRPSAPSSVPNSMPTSPLHSPPHSAPGSRAGSRRNSLDMSGAGGHNRLEPIASIVDTNEKSD